MPKLITPDGELSADEVTQKFAQAMAAPEPGEPQAPAPAPADDPSSQASEVPQPGEGDDRKHSRARTASGAGSSSARGRRKTTGKAKTAAGQQGIPDGFYVEPVVGTLQGLTIAAALLPFPEGALGVRVRLQGHLINQHQNGLAGAIDAAARHNATIRRGVEALTMGSAGWVLPAVMTVVPFAMASAALWRGEVTEDMVTAAAAFQAAVQSEMATQAQAQGAGAPA